ncbi:16S rRNA pseudouridine(516) synthase [Paraburkholderia bonniea]|uniref:pseudouridine synthase n=1 Tax=Paraburkholderia bonniea TaxID=2152891 RepID=UPI00257326C2|nr:16S rRNA pseudouridine(516) synthase [Paraburkholderia bonniea]WJF90897.1 16S rRNA pseudouridine(516) synthase [Paraburkholderia bonniea]WJF94211.1 16S rRNA pseudouridine(516) synthase [Paraburkholderia bonniea]
MNLENILFSQGFGSRRECRALITQGRVTLAGITCLNPAHEVELSDAFTFGVDGRVWPCRERVYVLLNKPAGYECSREPQHHLSVLSLLPPQFATRGVQCVGRLDQDTTGLLLFSDDGQFIHALTSPKRKVPKVYLARTRHPLDATQLDALRTGVLLHGEAKPVAALAAQARSEHLLELTVQEGKYHQVKRMVAAAGNRVEALHREQIGQLTLPATLAEGAWQWLDAADLERLAQRGPAAAPGHDLA